MATIRYTTVDGEILSENRGGTIRDYVPDPLGSTRALLNSSQTITDTWSYWPYGEVQASSGSSTTPFTFVGSLGYHKDATGLTYVRARVYHLSSGQWMTIDPTWPREQAYIYATTNPVSWSDATGVSPQSVTCKALFDDCINCLSYVCDKMHDVVSLGRPIIVAIGAGIGGRFGGLGGGMLGSGLGTALCKGYDDRIDAACEKARGDCKAFLAECNKSKHVMCAALADKKCWKLDYPADERCWQLTYNNCMKFREGSTGGGGSKGLPDWVYDRCPGLFKDR